MYQLKKHQVTTKETTTPFSEMLLWFFPWNNNNKNDARNLEEVTIFHPISNTTPDPRGIDMPVGCTAAPMQTHSQGGGMLEPQVILDPLETPASAPGLNGELLPWLPSPVPWGPGEQTPRAIAHRLHGFLLSHMWNQTFAFLLWYQSQKNTIHNLPKKWRERNIEKNVLFLKKKTVTFLLVVL